MFAKLLDTTAIDAFAEGVLDDLRRRLTPTDVGRSGEAHDRKRAQFDASLRRRTEQFVTRERLSFFQKARLGTRLQARLEDGGYPTDFSRELARDVVKLVATLGIAR